MSAKIFLDTNILIYQFSIDEQKQNKAIHILESAFSSNDYAISYQVIQEFSNVALSKNKSFFSNSELIDYTETVLKPLCKFLPDLSFYSEAIQIKESFKYSYFDSLIITAALRLKCQILYSEDLNHLQIIEKMQIVNPFLN